MCTLIRKNQKPIRAEKDIIIYKTVIHDGGKNYYSSYMGFCYNLNKLYKAKMFIEKNLTASDNVEKNAWLNKNGEFPSDLTAVTKGFHSATTKKRLKTNMGKYEILIKGIIPKGSLYYKGKTNIIVSNKIKLLEICEK